MFVAVDNRPMISVVVPVYNVEPYLKQCVDSLLGQTYSNIEIILVDDGSTDGSSMMCDEYSQQHDEVKVIHQRNQGLSAARNAGLEIATGEYITFVDSDDWLEECMVEQCIQLMQKYQAEVCGVVFLKEYPDRSEINEVLTHQTMCYSSKTALTKYLFNSNLTVCVCGKVWKKSLWEDIRCPYGRLHEDQMTTYKLLDKAKNVVFYPAALYHYRQRSGSIGHSSFSPKSYDLLEAIDEQYEFISNKYPDIKKSIGIACSFWYMVFYNMMIRSDAKDSVAVCHCRKFVKRHLIGIMTSGDYSFKRKLQLILFCVSETAYRRLYLMLRADD